MKTTSGNPTKKFVAHPRVAPKPHGNEDDPVFRALLKGLQTHFPSEQLFTTDAEGLFEAYLKSFPWNERQYHNCNACKYFMSRYGGLVTILESGKTVPAYWDPALADPSHDAAFTAMQKIIKCAKVTGVFLSPNRVLGAGFGGEGWIHFRVEQPNPFRETAVKNAHQAMAEKAEDFKNVQRALDDFDLKTLGVALSLLNSDALYRSEKVLGQAEWLNHLQVDVSDVPKSRRDNIVWRAVADAPAGFCHPRSSMIGTLLEDIVAGYKFDEVSKRFAAKMHPLAYQRPVAAPKAGNIDQAEKIIAKMESEGAFERRFARLEELEDVLWFPQSVVKPRAVPKVGMFSHLRPAAAKLAGMYVSGQKMTWKKFESTLLDNAHKLELYVPYRDNFAAIVTAAKASAPLIFQWGNPFSWYLYNGGSFASQWNLASGTWATVNAVTLGPPEWNGGNFPHQGERAFFILDGATDSRNPTLCIFPETLKSEYHSIRSVIEAHSRSGTMKGARQASACGLCISKGNFNVRLRMTDDSGTKTELNLDRWD